MDIPLLREHYSIMERPLEEVNHSHIWLHRYISFVSCHVINKENPKESRDGLSTDKFCEWVRISDYGLGVER